MKDGKFGSEIQCVLDRSASQEGRLNSRLKLRLTDCSRAESFVEYAYDVEEWSLNPYGGIHGGIICSIFDTGMGIGAAAIAQKMVSTADISVSYLKPMNGNMYIFRIEYTNIGRRMIRTVGKAIDPDNGQICATSMASFVITESKAQGVQV